MTGPSGFWVRLVAILETNDPMEIAWKTGVTYTTATRWRSGKSGQAGPRADDLAAIVKSIREKTGRDFTMGQLWGTEELPILAEVNHLDELPTVADVDPGASAQQSKRSGGRRRSPPGDERTKPS